MNTGNSFSFDWRKDLEHSRDLTTSEKSGFEILLGWFENWRIARQLPANRDAARDFWKAKIISKQREPWQLEQWAAAIRWYLNWLNFCRENGHSGQSLCERIRIAVDRAGGRRGLALRTRQS